MASDVVSEPPTKKSCSLSVSTINAADNVNLAGKIKITQEDGSVASYTTHVEAELSETPKEYPTSSTKDTP